MITRNRLPLPNCTIIQMKEKHTADYGQLLQKAAAYCSLAEHCITEVQEKLAVWGATSPQSEDIIAYLQENGFIDEARYCRAFVSDKFRYNKWGKYKIKYQLRMKGLSDASIQQGMEMIEEEDYEEALVHLLSNKLKGLKYNDEYDKQGKLYRFAQGRGFERDVFERAYQHLHKN